VPGKSAGMTGAFDPARLPVRRGDAVALLFYSRDDDPKRWGNALRREVPDLDFRVWPDLGDPAEIDMALVWLPPRGLLRDLVNLKAIFSLGAGVDSMLDQGDRPDLPLCRLIDPSLTRTMSEFVLANVLYYHRDLDRYARQQQAGRWDMILPQPPSARTIGILGLGELGGDAARLLVRHGFNVRGWSRRGRTLEGVESFAGPEQLRAFLAGAEYLVCLLPLTGETAGILNAGLFESLPRDSVLIHVGRGRQLVPEDLMAALDSGQLRAALLDVTPVEPLPVAERLWRHPGIRITPHAASYALPETAAATVAANIRRLREGLPLEALVDRDRGY
jgi:glyoxylate/hydroxypyruvate reductase A